MERSRRNASLILTIAALLIAFGPRLGRAQAPVLSAKFDVNVNSKTAKVGDAVTAKVQKAAKLADGTAVPKGSKLVGKVTAVESVQSGNGTATLNIQFEHIEAKGAAAIPIKGLIVAIGAESDSDSGSATSVFSSTKTSASSSHGNKGDSDLAKGSTLEGVALALSLDGEGASDLRGVKRDIKIDSSVLIKVELEPASN